VRLDVARLASARPVTLALQLRNLQILAEIAIEKKSTIVFPAQFTHSVRAVQQFLDAGTSPTPGTAQG